MTTKNTKEINSNGFKGSLDDLIAVKDLARELGMGSPSVHNFIKELGIERIPIKIDGKGMPIQHIRLTDCVPVRERARRRRRHWSRPESQPDWFNDDSGPSDNSDSELGMFYLMLPEPELAPTRFKLGYSKSPEGRRRQFLTAAPFIRIERAWPCKSLWEKTAIDFISQGCERLNTEVFKAGDIGTVIERADSFFALSPPLENQESDNEEE